MVNPIHVILRNRPDVVAGWSDEEVAKRWWQLFRLRKNKDKSPAIPTEDELRLFMSPARSKQLRNRSARSSEGQVRYVRRDEWLTPLTLDERSVASRLSWLRSWSELDCPVSWGVTS